MSVSTFFHKLENEFKVLFKRSPDVIVQISSTINATVPLIEAADVLIVPQYAPILNPILESVRVGFAALAVTIKDSGVTPNTASIVTSISAHLNQLLTAADIKDPASKQKFVAAVTLIQAETEQISTAIQEAQASKTIAAPAAPAAVAVVPAAVAAA